MPIYGIKKVLVNRKCIMKGDLYLYSSALHLYNTIYQHKIIAEKHTENLLQDGTFNLSVGSCFEKRVKHQLLSPSPNFVLLILLLVLSEHITRYIIINFIIHNEAGTLCSIINNV